MGALQRLTWRGDLMVASGIVGILAVLLLPMGPLFLDLFLGVSLMFSVLILMVSLFIQRPLEFSAFPTVLLIATMMRLSLNLASTRLILANGHEGTDAAGDVIQAFGNFIMQGNVVIGVIIFAILVLVNFMVITKGSGRIAEVAARFTLDSMPGKQMAIDADLSAGLIDEETAKKKRKDLEDESNFFGAMDGASKFVRGDAMAGLIITFINVVGGMVIGMAQNGMDFATAANTYTLLTVGDGLVSQIPALIVSVGAGLLVSKSGVDGSTDKALVQQFTNYPQALGMAAAVLGIVILLPGTPKLTFLGLAGACGYGAYVLGRQQKEAKRKASEAEAVQRDDGKPTEEPISSALAMDNLRLELGYGLLPLINDAEGYRLTDQIKALRRQLATDMGFVMPSVRILDNMQLSSEHYAIKVKEMDAGEGTLKVGALMVMDPRGAPIDLPGEDTTEPAFGLPARWVDAGLREEAAFRGYTVVDPATVLTTHLTEVLKDNMPELLSYAETKKLLDDVPGDHQKLIEDLVPGQISMTGVQRILQALLRERVSIRDLATILEGISEATGFTQSIPMITEHVRMRLGRQICAANQDPGAGYLPLVVLSPDWEQAFAESLVGQGEERQLAMAPSQLQDFINQVRTIFEQLGAQGEMPVLLTSPLVRPYARSVVERFRPQTVVMSQNEIHPQARLKTLGQI
ncbi:MAG: flagellar biosynthesis protein FlhA [Alphaproteobacteria bacterium]